MSPHRGTLRRGATGTTRDAAALDADPGPRRGGPGTDPVPPPRLSTGPGSVSTPQPDTAGPTGGSHADPFSPDPPDGSVSTPGRSPHIPPPAMPTGDAAHTQSGQPHNTPATAHLNPHVQSGAAPTPRHGRSAPHPGPAPQDAGSPPRSSPGAHPSPTPHPLDLASWTTRPTPFRRCGSVHHIVDGRPTNTADWSRPFHTDCAVGCSHRGRPNDADDIFQQLMSSVSKKPCHKGGLVRDSWVTQRKDADGWCGRADRP